MVHIYTNTFESRIVTEEKLYRASRIRIFSKLGYAGATPRKIDAEKTGAQTKSLCWFKFIRDTLIEIDYQICCE